MWEIYSIGDSAYLAAILNAVAMITGTGDFRQLAGVGFLIGVLLVLFWGILQGGRGIRFQNILVAWLLYALMFGPTAKVAIEDAYSGAVRVVDNVPLGPAAVGFLEKGIVQTHEDLGQWKLAAITEQAAQQRNAQWTAEQTLFTRIVRPMMTFFEGLIFAITPLMAFTIALGPAGIAMTGKYLLFALWIQLWRALYPGAARPDGPAACPGRWYARLDRKANQ
jgi:hypothetical protein